MGLRLTQPAWFKRGIALFLTSAAAVSGLIPVARAQSSRSVSPLRPDGVDYHDYLDRSVANSASGQSPHWARPFDHALLTRTVSASRGPLEQIDLTQIPEVSAADLDRAFSLARDATLLNDTRAPNQRRLTWLYPDDGCFARAQLASKLSLYVLTFRPAKLFVYGNLKLLTANHPKGQITWWYHVAPVVKVATQVYVIDPAVGANAPIKLEDWVSDLGPNTKEFAVCTPFAYNPDSVCNAAEDPNVDTLALTDEVPLLQNERDRIAQLGRDPIAELGDHPPWRLSP